MASPVPPTEPASERRVAPPLKRHRTPKLAEVIAADLRARILGGELKPGESLLGEAMLMEQFDVSRPTLREALRLLEAQNLIVVRRGSHRGPVVSRPDVWVAAGAVAIQLQLRGATYADVYRFRMVYEPVAARLAAENVTEVGVARLRAIIEQEQAQVGDSRGFAEAAWSFHSVLVDLGGNATMAVVTESLQCITGRAFGRATQSAQDPVDWQQRSVKAHLRLVDLIAKGDGRGAEAYWSRHMASIGEMEIGSLASQLVTELGE
jgi:DNA-binding FadR family transcriptional regulator